MKNTNVPTQQPPSQQQQKSGGSVVWNSDKSGNYVRPESSCRNRIEPNGDYPPAKGRYHIYASYACPWACRCLAVMALKGLNESITQTIVHPIFQLTKPDDPTDKHAGWVFVSDTKPQPFKPPYGRGEFTADGCEPNTLNSAKSARELYDISGNGDSPVKSVPILWDKETNTIVNNESSEIVRMLNSEFNGFAKNPDLDLYPEHLRKEIDEINDDVYPNINNGVYRCGFAKSQESYDKAVTDLFNAMDRCENLLSKRRYLCGDAFTEADVRLFVTLIRFDEVYAVHFKANKKQLREYPNLFHYTKEIYQMPGIAETVNMDHIKKHYYGSHAEINKFSLVPAGPDIDFSTPHDRDRKYPDKKTK